MYQFYPKNRLPFLFFFGLKYCLAGIIILVLAMQATSAQAVSGIITDYKGYWKSSKTSVNSINPNNNHNLLAFTYNGVTYSTGVDDGLLTSHGDAFVANDFWSLPVETISGTINSNTKVGLGSKYDGVRNGASNPPPDYDIAGYLTDGIKGLNIGTCIANLPEGTMSFLVYNIKPGSIGDGIPDILVTQVADPSNSFDRYHFSDVNGHRVGNNKDIVFTSIPPVGSWTADFYEASHNPLILTSSFTKTDRFIRLWAADLSEFGITTSNYGEVRNFVIGLSGVSDVAFVAYSANSFAVSAPLSVKFSKFTGKKVNDNTVLNWTTETEINTTWHIIERSNDNKSFIPIDSVKAAGNSVTSIHYSWIDKKIGGPTRFYRLKTVDRNGNHFYASRIVTIKEDEIDVFKIAPNPLKGSANLTVIYKAVEGQKEQKLAVYDEKGILLFIQALAPGSIETKLNLGHLANGTYYVVLMNNKGKQVKRLIIARSK